MTTVYFDKLGAYILTGGVVVPLEGVADRPRRNAVPPVIELHVPAPAAQNEIWLGDPKPRDPR